MGELSTMTLQNVTFEAHGKSLTDFFLILAPSRCGVLEKAFSFALPYAFGVALPCGVCDVPFPPGGLGRP